MAISDDFNRASLGTNWQKTLGTNDWAINASTTARPATAYTDTAMRYVGTFPNDQYAEVDTEFTTGGDGGEGSVAVRMDASGNCYYAQIGNNSITIFKRVAGSRTYLTDGSTTAAANTLYKIKIQVTGTSISAYLGGSLVCSTSDSSLTSGNPGLFAHTGEGSLYPDFDNFAATDVVGGSSYNQNVSGSVTPAGTLAKQTGKPVSGSVAPSGLTVRSIATSLTGAIAGAGSLIRSGARSLAGALTPSGAVAALRIVMLSLSGSLTPAGSLLRSSAKTLSGAVASAGAVAQQAQKIIGGTITPAGNVLRSLALQLAGSIAAAGSVVKSVSLSFAGSVSSAGTLVRESLKALAGSIASSGAIQALRSVLLSLAGSLTPSGIIANTAQKVLSGSVGLAGTLIQSIGKLVSGAIAAAGQLWAGYPSVIKNTGGLVAYWRLGESSGATVFDAQGGNSGQYVNGVTLGQAGMTSDGDTAASFDGSDDYIAIPHHASLNFTSAVSVELWWKPVAGLPEGYSPLIGKPMTDNVDNDNFALWAYNYGDGTYDFAIYWSDGVNPNASFYSATQNVSEGAWHHIVAVIDDDTGAIYLDGSALAPAFSSSLSLSGCANSFPIHIGAAVENTSSSPPSPNYPTVSGTIDEVALYDVALTSLQVSEHYNAATISTLFTKLIAGTVTPLASLLKSTARTLAASVAPGGGLIRQSQKMFSGTISPAATLNAIKAALLSLSGALAPSGSIAQLTDKTFSAAIAASATLINQAEKALSGAIATTGDMSALRAFLRTLTGSIAPSGTLVNSISVRLAGAVASAGNLVKSIAMALTGSIASAGNLINEARISLAGSIASSATLASLKAVMLSIGGALTPAGSLLRSSAKTLSGAVASVGNLVRQTAKSFAGAIGSSGAASALKIIFLALVGSVAPAGSILRSVQKIISGAIPLTGSILKSIARRLAGAVALAGSALASLISGATTKIIVTVSSGAVINCQVTDGAATVCTVSSAAPINCTVSADLGG